jgi:hypothetical protein
VSEYERLKKQKDEILVRQASAQDNEGGAEGGDLAASQEAVTRLEGERDQAVAQVAVLVAVMKNALEQIEAGLLEDPSVGIYSQGCPLCGGDVETDDMHEEECAAHQIRHVLSAYRAAAGEKGGLYDNRP